MSKCAKGLLIAAFCILSTWLGLAYLYTYSVSEELTLLRRESRSDTVYLRYRIRELESELDAERSEGAMPPAEAVDGEVAETEEPSSYPEAEGSAPTEEVTLPTHQSPETQAPDEESTAAPASLYLIAERDGIIGLFDASGARLRSVNIFVMTLPEADRAALAVGIPAASWEEAVAILDRFS